MLAFTDGIARYRNCARNKSERELDRLVQPGPHRAFHPLEPGTLVPLMSI